MDPALREIIAMKVPAKEMEAIIKLAKPDVIPKGAQLVAQFGDIATCRLQVGNIEEVWADDAVVSLKAPRAVGQEPAFEGYDNVAEGASLGVNPTPFTGKGIVIGIVDWGFDFTHPNFLNPDGSTRFLAIWDQTVPADTSAAKYGYGKVHTQQQLNEALKTLIPFDTLGYHPAQGDPDSSGSHGTHVTDIAAGNGTVGTLGMAPNATLVGVHLSAGNTGGLATLGDSVRILEAIDFIAEMAGEIPLVINLSVGKHGGAHQGNSLVEQGMDNFLKEKPGRTIVNSAGNYFSAQIHASGRVMPGGSTTIAWEVDKNDHTPNELEVWYSHRDKLRLKIQLPSIENHTVKVDLGENKVLTFQGKIVGRAYHRANEPNTGDNHIDIFLYKNAPKGTWRLTLEGIDVVDGRWHAWIERDGGCHSCQSKFPLHTADPSFTTGSICNGMYTIAVGAYDTRDPERKAVFFSSAGPTSDGRKKPNLLAPGMGIQAARSTRVDAARSKGELTFKSGTSMAAPHVTGAIALLFEVVGQRLPIERTRSLLLSSADPPPKGEERTIDQYGEGYLNVESLIDAARKYSIHQKLLTMKNTSNFREEESEELIFDEGENLFEEEDEAFMEDEFSYPEEADEDIWSDVIEDIGEQSAPKASRDFRLVLDSDARIRTNPPNLASTNERIPKYALVEVSRTLMHNGREYVFAKRIMRPGHSGSAQPWGWTLASNLEANNANTVNWANVKQALVQFANQEYNFWNNQNILFETDSAVFDRQKAYWGAIRAYPTNTQLRDTDWQEENDWGGAFISYIAAQAGAGTHFCYNRYHTCYIVCARTNRKYNNLNNPFWAYELTAPEVAWPEPGDIVCKNQPGGQSLTLNSIVCEDLAHCDIVEAVYRKSRQMITIGGDVDNRVARRVVHLNAQGFIDTMQHWEIDNAGKRQPPPFYSSQDQYFAIIKVRTSLAAAPVATGSSASGGTGSLPSSSTTTDFAAEMQAVEWGNSEDFDTEDTLLEDDDEFFYQNETEEEEEFEDLNTETETVWMEKDNLFSYENAYEYEEEEEGDEAADCGCHKTTMQEDMHTGQHSDCRACGEYLVEQAEAWMQTGTTEDFMEGFFIGGAIMSEAFSPHKNGNSQAKQMFDSIAFGKSTPLGESWEEGAEVIAMPKSKLTNSLLPGDIVLSRSYGDGKTWQSIAHNGELFNRQQAVAKGFSPDSTKPGIYLEVITMKPIRRHQGEGFVKRIGDEWGRLLPDCMVLRANMPVMSRQGDSKFFLEQETSDSLTDNLLKFLVYFERPKIFRDRNGTNLDYAGYFGFDKLRDEFQFPIETVNIDNDGTTAIGVRRPLCKNIETLKATYLNGVTNVIKPYEKDYYPCWFTIFPHTTTAQFPHGSDLHKYGINLSLELEEIDSLSAKDNYIEFKSDDPRLTIKPKKITLKTFLKGATKKIKIIDYSTNKTKSTWILKDAINIRCKGGTINKHTEIKVFAVGKDKTEQVGQLMAYANNVIPKAEIVLVKVVINNESVDLRKSMNDHEYILKYKSFNQALIRAEIKVDTEFKINELDGTDPDVKSFKTLYGGLTTADASTFLQDVKKLYEKFGKHRPANGKIDTAKRTYLFITEVRHTGTTHGIADLQSLNVRSKSYTFWQNTCVVFKPALEDNTTFIHEIGHTLSLFHSFEEHSSNLGPRFYHGFTDNAMDYDWKFGGASNPYIGKRFYFYRWQWDTIRGDKSLITSY